MRDHAHPSVAIGAYLANKGYVLSDETGRPFDGPVEAPALGVLTSEYFTPEGGHHFLIWSFGKKQAPHRIMLGVIRFPSCESAVMDVYGKDHVQSMMLLAHEIESHFALKMKGHLAKDETIFERLPEEQQV